MKWRLYLWKDGGVGGIPNLEEEVKRTGQGCHGTESGAHHTTAE